MATRYVLVEVSAEYYEKLRRDDVGTTVVVERVIMWGEDAQLAVDDANDRARKGEACDGGNDRCPGCKAAPGDGLTAGCDHPDGCGYWRLAARGGR